MTLLLGHLTSIIIPQMTNDVLSGTLNPTILYDGTNVFFWFRILSFHPHDTLKTIADICFLLGSYTDWSKVFDEFACQDHQGQGHFWRVRSHSVILLSYSDAGSEIPSSLASFSRFIWTSLWDLLSCGWQPLCVVCFSGVLPTRCYCRMSWDPTLDLIPYVSDIYWPLTPMNVSVHGACRRIKHFTPPFLLLFNVISDLDCLLLPNPVICSWQLLVCLQESVAKIIHCCVLSV